jgi:hypothetical protein
MLDGRHLVLESCGDLVTMTVTWAFMLVCLVELRDLLDGIVGRHGLGVTACLGVEGMDNVPCGM